MDVHELTSLQLQEFTGLVVSAPRHELELHEAPAASIRGGGQWVPEGGAAARVRDHLGLEVE